MSTELEKIAVVYGDVCIRRRKTRRKRQKLLVMELFFEYAKNSTLHGFRYIVDQGLTLLERLFWFLTVIASILLCLFYIYNLIIKWKTSPVIVTMNERLSSVASVPFPSVTICPQKKVNTLRYNYTEKLKKIEKNDFEEIFKFQHIAFQCDDYSYLNIKNQSTELYWNSSMIEDIVEAAPDQEDIFVNCFWLGQRLSCKKLFSHTLTRDGVCFTINDLAADDIFEDDIQFNLPYIRSTRRQKGWTLNDGYNNSRTSHFPRRGRIYSSNPDLNIILKYDPSKSDLKCNNIYSGFKIYLHHPADFPQSSLYYYAALPDQLSSVAISFHELNSDSSVMHYNSKVRQCYFPSERKLRYFKIYTATNCQAECLSNYTYKKCKCVGFYMPHHNHSRICNLYNSATKNCVDRSKDSLATKENDESIPDGKKCNCLPACNTVEYDAEILKTEFKMQDYSRTYNERTNFSLKFDPNFSYSQVSLFYKKSHFVTMQRRELYGFTDLLANIGGLLGVFLGFSFLSLIELLYFLSFRVGFILKRDLKEEKAKERSRSIKNF